jgi:integrase
MLRDADDTWTISKRVLTTASKLFEHAAGLHIVAINPCAGVSLTSLFGPRPPVKKRVMLSADDLRTLFATLDTLGTENGLALRILLATCVRTNELVTARWENIDLEKGNWFVPNELTKTRNGFLVPLTPPVIGWFRDLQALAGTSPFVLPARISRKAGQPITTRTLWAAIDRAFDTGRLTVTKFTPHDTRSTAKGHMRNLGISEFDTERALSHAIKGVSGIYDVREEIPEKRHALQVWANFLLTLASPKAAEPAPKQKRLKVSSQKVNAAVAEQP